jgi:ankyrin repeat protein
MVEVMGTKRLATFLEEALPEAKRLCQEDDEDNSDDSNDIHPADFVVDAFRSLGFDQRKIAAKSDTLFIEPTPEMMAAYTKDTTQALRENNIDKLRDLHKSGVQLNCCNKFGDSSVHIACRRGNTEIVKFLLEEVQIPIYNVRDDFKRTPLHDACWTSKPNFALVDVLLRAAPEHALLPDSRGDTPFNYVRVEHWDEWVDFLAARRSLMYPKGLIPKRR